MEKKHNVKLKKIQFITFERDSVFNGNGRIIEIHPQAECKQYNFCKSDGWLTVHRNSAWIRKTN